MLRGAYLMRNILAHIPQKQKKPFAPWARSFWIAPEDAVARELANILMDKYGSRSPQAIRCLEEGLEDPLFCSYPELNQRKTFSNNMIEQFNRKIRRRTYVVGIFPNEASYVRIVRLVVACLMEYSED
jgi:putative transposase